MYLVTAQSPHMNLKIFEFYKYLLLVGIFLIMNPIIGQSTDSKKGNVKMKTYNYADTLLLDFYSVQTDTFMMKPTIILVHGGGFTAGQRNGGDEKGISTYLAKLGFNVASIDYRLLLFFHSVKDSVVPYGTNAHRNCATTDVGYLNLNGPKSIAERLSDIDGNYKVYYSEEGGHEWASLGFDFPELISRFIDQVLNGEATMRDFETIISTVESK